MPRISVLSRYPTGKEHWKVIGAGTLHDLGTKYQHIVPVRGSTHTYSRLTVPEHPARWRSPVMIGVHT